MVPNHTHTTQHTGERMPTCFWTFWTAGEKVPIHRSALTDHHSLDASIAVSPDLATTAKNSESPNSNQIYESESNPLPFWRQQIDFLKD